MEGLKLRTYVVAGLLLVGAASVYLTPKPSAVSGEDENFMGKIAPVTVVALAYQPNIDGQTTYLACSYKTSKFVYDALVPTVGILARVYRDHDLTYDVTLIASRDKGSFHDPRIC